MAGIDWTKLSEPFPDEEIKHRPGAATWDHKQACEGNRCRETRDAAKHIQFSYIDARAVAQRLDEVLTPVGWSFVCQHIGEGVVHGRLSIGDSVREDHGYPNSDRDEEPIKAATSDALKRCAVLFGIGRHLYEDNKPGQRAPQTRQNGSQRPAPPRLAPREAPPADKVRPPVRPNELYADLPEQQGSVPQEPDWIAGDTPPHLQAVNDPAPVPPTNVQTDRPMDIRDGAYADACPDHSRPWRTNSKGYYCSGKTEGDWCKWRPSKRWIAEHETVPA